MKRDDPARDAGNASTGDGIYRAIQWLLFLDVVIGLGLAVVGQVVLQVDSIVYVGLGLAVVGLVLMLFFRVLAAREAASRRHAADAARHQRLRRAGEAESGRD
jgi:hypothetical protein